MDPKDARWVSRLYIAVPELFLREEFRRYLRREGLITPEGLSALERLASTKRIVDRVRARASKQRPFSRLLAIAPELVNESNVNLLRRYDLMTEKEAHFARLALRSIGAVGNPTRDGGIQGAMVRATRLFGVGYSRETIDTLLSMGKIDEVMANRMRTGLYGSKALVTSAQTARNAKTLADWLMLAGSTAVDRNTLNALKAAGIINTRTANAMLEAARYAGREWNVWEGSKRADGFVARLAYVLSGSFSWEAIDFMRALGFIPKDWKYEPLLKIAVSLSTSYNRQLMEQFTKRRYRPVVGESPIRSFARASKDNETRLLRLLAVASDDARKEALAWKGLASDQRQVRAANLHRTMRELWEGVGYLTISGERQTAEAAIESLADLQRGFMATMPENVDRMSRMQMKAGVDAFISRQENRIDLSRRVYKNYDLSIGKINQRIDVALLKGASADELARDIVRYISPSTPGGAAYAARRLARTELANAFHTTTIRYGREMPWIQGFKWNLSGSHPKRDICNDYAERDSKLGQGVYSKRDVPGKPHPQCFCFLTQVTVDNDVFIDRMKRGYYNSYMEPMMTNPDVQIAMGEAAMARTKKELVSWGLPVAATLAVKKLASATAED